MTRIFRHFGPEICTPKGKIDLDSAMELHATYTDKYAQSARTDEIERTVYYRCCARDLGWAIVGACEVSRRRA